MKYMRKQELIGVKTFDFRMIEETDEVIITNYIDNGQEFRVIEIPDFVTGTLSYADSLTFSYADSLTVRKITPFYCVRQSLKIIHKNNQIKDMLSLFNGYLGKKLDLSEFDTTGVENMREMFKTCSRLEEIDLSNFNTSSVKDMTAMFYFCGELKHIDIKSFNTDNLNKMSGMFAYCCRLEEIDFGDMNTNKVNEGLSIFHNCWELMKIDTTDELLLSSFRNKTY